uniref:Uncharacterized protein n=1 Tax=Globodera rostochiensis TaxID=31243 RepID=A0A914GYU9_GLORO
MDSSGKKTKLVGILMRRVELGDNSLICVWNWRNPLKEYKFPRWANEYNVWFRCGELVGFEPAKPVEEVQDAVNIWKLEPDNEQQRRISITYPLGGDTLFLVKVLVSFPPLSLDHYKDELTASKSLGCRAIGWSVELGKVSLLDESVDFKSGICYSGCVARISPDKDWIAEKMGTLWVVDASTPLKEVTDPESVSRMHQRIPWRASLVTSVVGSATGAGTFASYDALPSPAPSSYQHMASMNLNPSAPQTAHRPMMLSDDWTDDLDDTLRKASESVDSRTSRLLHSVVGQQQRQNTDVFLPPSSALSSSNMLVHHQPVGERRHQQIGPSQESDLTTNNRENVLFGNLVALKLESIHARNANAAIQLQKAIMDLCSNFELKVLNPYNNDQFLDPSKAFGAGINRG